MRIRWLLLGLFVLGSMPYLPGQEKHSRPIVNQIGYNLGETKRFVCYGAGDGTPFQILHLKEQDSPDPIPVYEGEIHEFVGDFSALDPEATSGEFIVRVDDKGDSHPFWIADHLMEKISTQLGYQFFIDVRGSTDPIYSNEAQVAGGGPSRDGGAYTLEALYEVLLYASNPALFDRWHTDFGNDSVPDLIHLILWHAEFAYHHRDYNGPTGHRPYFIGHPGDTPQTYDYQNTLDQLAVVCAAYHSFLKPYLSLEKYQRYRQACLQKWEAYERDQVVRYWVNSRKWVDVGWQEFNEMGNVFGQSVYRNLCMYLCEKNEPEGDPEKFLAYARKSAQDIIQNWDFNNPRHMWWIRNGEHITPQALAFFLLVAPESAPHGIREKLAQWASHMKMKTDNFWHYRKHSETEWAHPKTKELGNTGLGGSMFVIADLLNDPELRSLGWSQVNQVFGLNPAQAHYGNKSEERVQVDGYWEGVEVGWPDAHPDGAGKLGLVRGTLDGTPLDNMFPYEPEPDQDSVLSYYATEGWAVTNRAWLSTIVFSTLGSHHLQLFDVEGQQEIESARVGDTITLQLKAALNFDWNTKEKGWILMRTESGREQKIEVTETSNNSGMFTAKFTVPKTAKQSLSFSYGFMGFAKSCTLKIQP